MRIVQSFWSCNQKNVFNFNAGWYSPEYHLMGWALSCLKLREYYNDVTLYGDSLTAKLLIDTLLLPYTDVKCEFDNLKRVHSQLYSFPKIHTYSLQESSFLHIDGDVFIWKPFDDDLLRGQLIAQNLEVGTIYYENMMKGLNAELIYIPNEIVDERAKTNLIYAYNAGIFGGNDVPFFKLYTQKAKEIVKKNTAVFPKIDIGAFNIFFEQYFFHCLSAKHDKKVNVLFGDVIFDNEYTGFGDFNEVPHNRQYLHLLGPFKKSRIVCEQMANRLREEYPEHYYRIITLFRNRKIDLKKDYYFFVNPITEKNLTSRHSALKAAYRMNNLSIANDCYTGKIDEKKFRKEFLKTIIGRKQNVKTDLSYEEQLNDIERFENKLVAILKNKFTAYSKTYLYARDINVVLYFQYIFENTQSCHKKITTDQLVEVIKSKFDWSETSPDRIDEMNWVQQLNSQPSSFYTAIVPECDQQGYSLVNIDDIDLLLLEILQIPVTINEVLINIKTAFNTVEIEDSPNEFVRLITGRIKTALQNKLIKAVGI